MKKFKTLMSQEHQAAVAVEYVIIVVLMVVFIYAAFDILGDALLQKVREVAGFITGNGQTGQLNGLLNSVQGGGGN